MMLIAAFMYVSLYISDKQWAIDLAKTGQMTLTHYVSHLTIGLVILALLRGDYYSGELGGQPPLQPVYILLFSVGYFIISIYFSIFWSKKFKQPGNVDAKNFKLKINEERI